MLIKKIVRERGGNRGGGGGVRGTLTSSRKDWAEFYGVSNDQSLQC